MMARTRTQPSGSIGGRTLGRLAGVLFVGASVATFVSFAIDAPERLNDGAVFGAAAAGLVVGAFAFLAPWDRWPRDASLALAPIALAIIATSNYFGSEPNHAYSIFFVLVYVWLGVRQQRWVPLAMSPILVVAYLVPLFLRPGLTDMAAAVVALPTIVLVGESLAFMGAGLRRAEDRLRKDFLTAAAAADELKMTGDLKNRFLQGVSHDLRAPLTLMMGYASMISDSEKAGPEEREMAHQIITSVQRMDQMMRDLLDVDRLERNVLEPVRRAVDLRPLVEESIAAIGESKGREIRVIVPDGLTAAIDPAQASRALENLVRNAINHGGTRTAIQVRATDLPGQGVEFVVADNGPGVPDEMKSAIFERFVKGERSRAGTGLGLSLVSEFAQLHGGRAWVEDAPGGGAEFHVTMPGPKRSAEGR